MALLALAAALSGCVSDDPANPNLAAPKVVVQARPDGDVTLYVHGAFGERLYEWLTLRVDNVTVTNQTNRFSLETTTPARGFFLEVAGESGEQLYESRARVDIDPTGQRAVVSSLDAKGKWGDERSYSLPFGTILERRDLP